MSAYLPVLVGFCVGMVVFGLLRRLDAGPLISGAAAIFLSMAVVVAYFVFVVTTGRI